MHSAELSAMFHQKMVAQKRNVFFSLPKRWKAETDAIDPVKQLSPKTPRFHFLVEIPAGCRNQPRHEDSLSWFRLSVGQRVQKILLAQRIEFTDFIEKRSSCTAPNF